MSNIREKREKGKSKTDTQVPPYTKISVSIGSEGFHLELEENAHFEQAMAHYQKLIKEVTETKLLKSKKPEKGGVDVG